MMRTKLDRNLRVVVHEKFDFVDFFPCQMNQSSLALKMYQIVKIDYGETRKETLTGPSLVII